MTSLRDAGSRIAAAVAAALFFALIFFLLRAEFGSVTVPIVIAGMVLLGALRPAAGLLALAAIMPIAGWAGRWWNGSIAWAEALVVAFAAGCCARAALRPRDNVARDPLRQQLVLASVAVIASLVVQLAIEVWRFGGESVWARMWFLVNERYFAMGSGGDPLDTAMRLLESFLLMGIAVGVARQAHDFPARFIRWFVAGATTAALLNIWRLWEAAWRQESSVSTFFRYVMTVRNNVHYGDVNAAGSYFVMAALAAIGVALLRTPSPEPRVPRPWWWAAVAVIMTSIWITGSRAAVMAGLVAGFLPIALAVWHWRAGRARMATVGAAALMLLLLAVTVVVYIPRPGMPRPAGLAAQIRWEFAHTSLRMLATSPYFGIGVGQFYARSGEFSSPELLRIFPAAKNENAHNNFLQLLAELGIVGFAVFLWILWTAGARCMRLLRNDPHSTVRWGLVAGLLSFVLSCLAGHPLVIDEPAFSFWLLLGIACGWSASTAVLESWRPLPWIVTAIALVIVCSIPARTARLRAEFELEHRGIGVSLWQDALDGVRYRIAGAVSTVFVPAAARAVTVPLRAMTADDGVRVELQLDGRSADVTWVPRDRWHYFRILLPDKQDGPRFHRLDLRVIGAASTEASLLMIGKVDPR
jgi:O-Antigen ligase